MPITDTTIEEWTSARDEVLAAAVGSHRALWLWFVLAEDGRDLIEIRAMIIDLIEQLERLQGSVESTLMAVTT